MKTKTKKGTGRASIKNLASRKLKLSSILVPIDFSNASMKALAYAIPFAKQFGAKLILLHVVEPILTPDFAKGLPLAMDNDEMNAASKKELQELIASAGIGRLVERTVVRQGRSFNEIAGAAKSLKADLIIISTHGFTGVKHVVLGSTTERVVRHASCPVLVVRENEREFV